jgi:GDP-L-fucose synthase
MNTYEGDSIVNIGSGTDLSIRQLVMLIKDTIGYEGEIVWKSSQPDGTPRKLLNIDILASMGWAPQISLEDGLRETVEWCHENEIF